MSCHRLSLNGGSSGDQPWASPDSVVLYNGETYYLDGAALPVSSTEGDTRAVADHVARGLGPEGLDGMFAIARWQRGAGALQLWRDRFGVKPLYWGPAGDGVAFGSRAAGVRELCGGGGVPGEAVVAYLSLRGPFADQDLYEGVHAVAPGGWMAWDTAGGATSGRWWEARPDDGAGIDEVSTDELEAVLLAAVEAALQADAGVGLCLSGGVDSSLLVAMARHLHGPDIATYVLSSDTNQDDVAAAEQVARHLGITPRVVDMRQDWPATLEHLVPLLDEPPTTESTLGVAALAAAARADGLKALVSGEGADEVFGGYEEYRTRAFTLDDQLAERQWLRAHLQPWLHGDIERFEQRVADKLARHGAHGNPGTFDLESRLARLLRRLDSAMMAHAVEGRVPYLVDTVASAGMSRSWSERTAGLGKQALRDVAGRWLPPWVAERPKRPFASGVRRRPEAVRHLLVGAQGALADVVTPQSLQAALDDPSQPQAWKVAALGAFLAAHDVGVASGVGVPS